MRATHKDLSHLPRARQLQTYVWVTWCCARAGQKKKTVACDKFLAALCSETLRDIEPRAGGEVLGYWGARDCLWIVPSEKATARVRQEFTPGVLKTLYEGKTIYDSLNAFTSSPTGLAWRHDDSLRWSEHLREDKHDMFARIAGQGIAAIRYRGELLIGYDDDEPGVVLIGTRKAVGVSGLSCRERYWWLCQPEGMVDRYPEERVAPWWTPERDAELAAWGTPNPETVRAAVADLVRAPDGTAPKIVLVTDRVETTEWSDSRDVVLASHTDWLTTSTRVLRDITTGHVPACTHGYRVFAREHFGAYLSRRPWVWSKYFGREHAFVLAVDPEHVAESLGVSSFTRETIARSRETMPDGMLVAGDTPVVRVTGRVGTGKSVLLYQIACKDPGVVVCVRPWMEVRHWEFLRKVLQSASLPITFVVDDVDPPPCQH